jgi:uncharacterized protein YdhG (YjbR/CyaY superfamily)
VSSRPDAYLRSVPEARKALLDELHAMVLRLYPQASVAMQYKMPTYHVGESWVAIANQKHYVSLYTCGYHHIGRFKQRCPQIKTGKGCINLKVTDDIPWPELESVVKHAIDHPKP